MDDDSLLFNIRLNNTCSMCVALLLFFSQDILNCKIYFVNLRDLKNALINNIMCTKRLKSTSVYKNKAAKTSFYSLLLDVHIIK